MHVTQAMNGRGYLAGAFIAIGCMMMLMVKSDPTLSPAVSSVLSGLCFSIGLFAVMTCSGELFTGDCLMVVGFYEGDCTLREMLTVLLCAWVYNFVGAMIIWTMFKLSGMNVAYADGIAAVATAKESMGLWALFSRSILCNFLVCMAVWIASQADTITGKLVASVIPVTTFVALGFEHSVANMFLYWAMEPDFGWVASHLAVCTLGNMIGGMGFGLMQCYARLEAA